MFDVIESRKYSERYEVQQMLMNCIHYLKCKYRDSIKKEVVSSAGDEFQGLFLDFAIGICIYSKTTDFDLSN